MCSFCQFDMLLSNLYNKSFIYVATNFPFFIYKLDIKKRLFLIIINLVFWDFFFIQKKILFRKCKNTLLVYDNLVKLYIRCKNKFCPVLYDSNFGAVQETDTVLLLLSLLISVIYKYYYILFNENYCYKMSQPFNTSVEIELSYKDFRLRDLTDYKFLLRSFDIIS